MKKIKLILFFIITTGITICKAQSDSAYTPQYAKDIKYVLISKLDVRYVGYVESETETTLTFINQKTKVRTYFYKSEIKSISPYNSNKSNPSNKLPEAFEENEHADYYMFASSSLLFKKNKITSTYHWGTLENIVFSINENVEITLNSIFFLPISLGVKCAFKVFDDNYIGTNVFGMANLSSKSPSENFFGYGAKADFTRGTSNNNFTISGGFLGLNAKIFSLNTAFPFLNFYFGSFAYCNRFSNNFALNIEGWYFPESQTGFAGVGIKYIADKNTSWTFGCYGLLNNFNNTFKINTKAIPLPYIGYSQSF